MGQVSKNDVLRRLSQLLQDNAKTVVESNHKDIQLVDHKDSTLLDRLKIDQIKIGRMIQSLEEVASQSEPENIVLYEHKRGDGLRIINKTVPFGTILIIYESRPDVTIEAAATAFKAGNRILLKGGKEASHTNLHLTQLWQQALQECGFDTGYVEYLNYTRSETQQLIKDNPHKADLIIPRGGEDLINFVIANSSVPVVVSGRGNNFLYVDKNHNQEMAIALVLNGKKRISVCNAIDKVMINKNIPEITNFLYNLSQALQQEGIAVYGSEEVTEICSQIVLNNDEDTLYEEYLSPKIYVGLSEHIDDAIGVINKYSGGHSAVIVTEDADAAEEFMKRVDCAAVYHNASSRFTDGGQFGVGAEIAISTQKIHFRGPLGAHQLVTNKWFVYGAGQTRD